MMDRVFEAEKEHLMVMDDYNTPKFARGTGQ
jgi:hypothetical protein